MDKLIKIIIIASLPILLFIPAVAYPGVIQDQLVNNGLPPIEKQADFSEQSLQGVLDPSGFLAFPMPPS